MTRRVGAGWSSVTPSGVPSLAVGPVRRRGYSPEILDGDLDAQWWPSSLMCSTWCSPPPSAALQSTWRTPIGCSTRRKGLSQALVGNSTPPRLFIVTRNAQPVIDGDRANPVHAVLWGLGRTLALEHPRDLGWHHRCRRLDARRVDRAPGAGRSRRASDGEDQVVYRAGCGTCRVCSGEPRCRVPAWLLGADTSHLVIGATGHIGPHLIQQLADMGARTIVAVSRNPGGRLDELPPTVASTARRR